MLSASQLADRVQARVGSTLRGKYRLDSVLGIGGMGAVYAATHRNTKRFAVKMLHPELSANEDIRSRFLREGYAANSVGHPGTVAVLDDDVTEDGAAFLVMELLEGVGIDSLWSRHGGKLPPKVAVAIVDQLLDVLAAAHARGTVHRDIKPANLFLTHEGTVKVLDFGIARVREAVAAGAEGGSGTATGAMLGSPAFMAPEQAMAKSSEVDAQTDLWAAAATLFTLVSGEFVHRGDNATQQLILAATQRARSLLDVAPQVPVPVIEVVDRGLTFEKTGRWPNAMAMQGALREAHTLAFGAPPERASLVGLGRSPASGGGPAGPRSETEAAPPAAPFAFAPMSLRKQMAPTVESSTGRGTVAASEASGTSSTTGRPVEARSARREEGTALRLSRRPLIAGAGLLGAAFAAFLLLRPRHVILGGQGDASTDERADSEVPRSAGAAIGAPVDASVDALERDFAPRDASEASVHDSGHPWRPPPLPPCNCDPNYTLDNDGNKHFKRCCFRGEKNCPCVVPGGA